MLSGSDRQAILDRSNRYYHDLDFSDWEALLGHFIPTARFESQVSSWTHYQLINPTLSLSMFGRESIEDLLQLLKPETAAEHSVARWDGKSVVTVSEFRYQHPDDPPDVLLTARSLNRLVKTSGTWQIDHRLIVVDWSSHPDAGVGASVVEAIADPAPPSIDLAIDASMPVLPSRDRDDVLEVLDAYDRAMAEGRSADALQFFTANARFEAPVRWWSTHALALPNRTCVLVGHSQILQFVANSGGGKAPKPGEVVEKGDVRVLHEATTCAIEGDADTAQLTRYFTFLWLDEPPKLTIVGQYHITLIREEETWKFSHLRCDFEFQERD